MIELKCKHCDRFLGEVETLVGEIRCSNTSCKAGNQFKIIKADETTLYDYKFATPPRPPKVKQVESSEPS